jgi:hypothetical protein
MIIMVGKKNRHICLGQHKWTYQNDKHTMQRKKNKISRTSIMM